MLREVVDSCYSQFATEATCDTEPGGFGPDSDGSWIILHLNHPKYHQGRQHHLCVPLAVLRQRRGLCLTAGPIPAHVLVPYRARLLDSICHPTLAKTVRCMFQGDFHLAQCNLYKDPPKWGASHSWHRDSQFFAGGGLEGKPLSDQDQIDRREQELIAAEASPPHDLHMHIPLESTQPNAGCASAVVPGSFNRWDTPEERRVRAEGGSGEMPGQLRLSMNVGDVGFFHVNCLHRGPSPADGDDKHVRRTIAVTWTNSARPYPITKDSMLARKGYVASYQPWILLPGYTEGCRPPTVALVEHGASLLRDRTGVEKLDAMPDGPLKQRYFMDWHPAVTTRRVQRGSDGARL